jgi:hypothetical protein
MPKEPPVKSADMSPLSVPAFWPMAMLEEGTDLYAKNLKFVEEETKVHNELRPLRRRIKFASICGPWCCAITESQAAFRRSSMHPMPVVRP